MNKSLFLSAFAAMSMGVASAQTSTEGLMTEQPAGTLRVYDRAGYGYYNSDDYVRRGAQTGTIDIVYGADNRVYLKDPLSKAITGVWVEGQLSADSTTITLPLGQPIAYDTNVGDSVVLGVMDYDEEEETFDEDANVKEVTYSVTGDVIKLNGTSRYHVLAAMWKMSKLWAEYADYDSKYTIKTDDDVAVVPPAELQAETYKMSAHTYVTERDVAYNVQLGFVGDDVYLQGIFSDLPNAWIKGTRNGNTLTFKYGQYLGPTHSGTTNYYMIATEHEHTSNIQNLVLTYDEASDAYTTGQFVVLNTARNTVYLVEALDNVVIKKVSVDGVYEVPYEGTFTGGLSEFTVIDGNHDGVTWMANTMGQTADYNWSVTNNADDWLISPKINLHAGKTYKVTVTARSMAGLLERFEAKLGNENTVEAMNETVIPATDVEAEDMTDFSGMVTIKNDGTYNVGIHAISDANNNGLYVKKLTVTEAESTDEIQDVTTQKPTHGNVYSLDGRLIRKAAEGIEGLPKGIYIHNDKKIVVK